MSSEPVKAVFFDVGQTLLTLGIPEEVSFVEAAASVGAHLDAADVTRLMPQVYARYEELYARDDSFWADEERATTLWLELYAYLAELAGLSDHAHRIAQRVHQTYFAPGAWKPFDDTLPTLDALAARGLRLGLISNWDSSLESIIVGMGLDHYFSVILASTVVRAHKPQRQIFDLALERLGLDARSAVHVGDHLQADVGGARAAGLRPVLLDRDHRFDASASAASGAQGDFAVIHSLSELEGLVLA
ncbi:MAG: HAD family hydrolase [Coriobacteriales bacterium]|jgi:REG-2-like HAD superfamily hydrolase|nr:HAD family hydrolase [Coriobacteriales bacterium]